MLCYEVKPSLQVVHCVVPENIHTPPTEWFASPHHPTIPLKIQVLVTVSKSYFSFKMWFRVCSSLGIFIDQAHCFGIVELLLYLNSYKDIEAGFGNHFMLRELWTLRSTGVRASDYLRGRRTTNFK